MFNNSRYLTRGIDTRIPPELALLLWHLIDELNIAGHQLDYLQVFTLSSTRDENGQLLQKIEHSQEIPPYQASYTIHVLGDIVTAKIFVVDDESHSTMLLAEEY